MPRLQSPSNHWRSSCHAVPWPLYLQLLLAGLLQREHFIWIRGWTGWNNEVQFKQAEETAVKIDLDCLVVIGGDDSKTNVCLLAKNFRSQNLKCKEVPTSFGVS